jgi:hypothetical protein
MTGAYLRAVRNGKWANVEVEHLTEEELKDKFLGRHPEELVNWMAMLCAKLRELEPLLDDLVKDGILAPISSNSANERLAEEKANSENESQS